MQREAVRGRMALKQSRAIRAGSFETAAHPSLRLPSPSAFRCAASAVLAVQASPALSVVKQRKQRHPTSFAQVAGVAVQVAVQVARTSATGSASPHRRIVPGVGTLRSNYLPRCCAIPFPHRNQPPKARLSAALLLSSPLTSRTPAQKPPSPAFAVATVVLGGRAAIRCASLDISPSRHRLRLTTANGQRQHARFPFSAITRALHVKGLHQHQHYANLEISTLRAIAIHADSAVARAAAAIACPRAAADDPRHC